MMPIATLLSRIHRAAGRLLTIPLALGLVLLFLPSLSTPAHAAGRCVVTPGRGTYPTVNSATSGASGAACSTVVLPAGTFSEQVNIDHALTLTGAGAGRTTILHPTPGPTTRSITQGSDAVDYVIDVSAPGVTISKLTIDGRSYGCHTANTCGSPSGYYALYGIDLRARHFTLDSVTIQHLGNARQQGDGYPIGGQASDSGSDQSATIKHSTFRSFTGLVLMALQPEPSPLVFTDNTVSGSPTSQFGLAVFGDGAQIMRNSFSGFMQHGAVSASRFPATIALLVGGANDHVSGNHFTNDDTGVLVAGASGVNTIENNTFQNTHGALILGLNAPGQIVRGNTIRTTRAGKDPLALGAGILLCQESGDQISKNQISSSVYGVAVLASTQSQCAAPSSPNAFLNNRLSRSSRYDLYDESRGGATGGTMDTYSGNVCRTSSPASLCNARATRGTQSAIGRSTPQGVINGAMPGAGPIGAYLTRLQHSLPFPL